MLKIDRGPSVMFCVAVNILVLWLFSLVANIIYGDCCYLLVFVIYDMEAERTLFFITGALTLVYVIEIYLFQNILMRISSRNSILNMYALL